MSSILTGVRYVFSGFALINKPGLRRFAIAPVIVNILIFSALFLWLNHYVAEFNVWLQDYMPMWLRWLSYLVWFLFLISFLVFFMFLFVTLANLVGAPFNGLLSEKVELFLRHKTETPLSFLDLVRDLPRMLGRQLSLLLYFIPRALAILCLFLVPIVQSITPFVWFLFSAWYVALSFVDFPTDNHRIPLKQVHVFLDQQRLVTLGFGVTVLLLLMVPVLNLFVIPAAVAGATHWWIDRRGRFET